jgi:hypothetical protein
VEQEGVMSDSHAHVTDLNREQLSDIIRSILNGILAQDNVSITYETSFTEERLIVHRKKDDQLVMYVERAIAEEAADAPHTA